MTENSNVYGPVSEFGAALCESLSERPQAPAGAESAPEAPFAVRPTEGAETVRCGNCDADVRQVGKGRCPGCGCWVLGNSGSVKDGSRRARPSPEQNTRRAELRTAIWEDAGGRPSPIIEVIIEDFVSTSIRREQVDAFLDEVGPLTQRGTRRPGMDLYLTLSARLERLSSLIGVLRSEAAPKRPTDTVTRIIREIVPDDWVPPEKRQLIEQNAHAKGEVK